MSTAWPICSAPFAAPFFLVSRIYFSYFLLLYFIFIIFTHSQRKQEAEAA